MKKYNYVYRITNKIKNMHYYGYRSTNINPKLDLGIKYFSSSTDKDFILDQKKYPENYKYIIVRVFDNRKDAAIFEIFLHNKFNVAKNDKFYNKSNSTLNGFIYGFLGKKHNKESRKLAITKKNITMKNTINDKGENLYNIAAKKGNLTKLNTIDKNGFNIHQNANKKFIENLDILKNGELLTTRQKLKKPKKNTENYGQNKDKIEIYDDNNNLIFKIENECLSSFCKKNNLPYTAFYKSKIDNSKLYLDVINKSAITILKNKNYYQYIGWYAKKI